MKQLYTLIALLLTSVTFGQESFFDTLSEAGFSFIYEGEQASFYLSSTSTDWIDARAICQELGGDLASFSSEQESIQVGQLLPTHILIGLYQDTSSSSYSEPSGGWVWTSGEALDWNLWQSTEQGTEPNNVNGGEDVAELFDGYYNDLPDNYAGYPFLLEISHGCMEESACNYDPEAILDDGSCHFNCQFCDDGTIWDEELFKCVVANPTDTDFDGCVGMTDLLDLLSVFGTCNETPWSCGDPLEYQGYDYETVQIGEQCWFAENLRSTSYENGDEIPGELSDEGWSSTTSGAMAVYGEGSSSCNTQSPDGDACDPNWSLAEYGRLYNWHAVNDTRGLCPSGWHVSTDEEWTVMTDELGGLAVAGGEIKATYGWHDGGNGTNSSGFAGRPGGYRRDDGDFRSAGIDAGWWSPSLSSTSNEDKWFRDLDSSNGGVYRNATNPRHGFSVRCIKDSE